VAGVRRGVRDLRGDRLLQPVRAVRPAGSGPAGRARRGEQRHLERRRAVAGPPGAAGRTGRGHCRLPGRVRAQRAVVRRQRTGAARADSAAAARPLERRRLLRDAADGVQHLVADRLLRALGVAQLLAALSAGATSALLVVYAREALEVTGSGYGLLLSAIGVGAAPGPLVLLRLIRSPRRPAFVFGPFAVRGVVCLPSHNGRRRRRGRRPRSRAALVRETYAGWYSALLQAPWPTRITGHRIRIDVVCRPVGSAASAARIARVCGSAVPTPITTSANDRATHGGPTRTRTFAALIPPITAR